MADSRVLLPTLAGGSQVIVVVSGGRAPVAPGGYAQVPDVRGLSQGDALTRLQDSGFKARVFNDYSDAPRGRVIGQAPRVNATADSDTPVVMLVSNGPSPAPQAQVALPDIVGATEQDAVRALQTAGLRPEVVTAYSAVVPEGVVADQVPSPVDVMSAPKKSNPWLWVGIMAVVLVVAVGAMFFLRSCQTESVAVPDVVGMQQVEGQSALEAAGFQVKAQEADEPGDAKEGEIVDQDPVAGSEAPSGSFVTITVVGAPKPVAVPDVIGMPKDEAVSTLEDLGLRANASTKEDGSVDPGTVIAQQPSNGTEVAPGSRVDITVASEVKAPSQVEVPDVVGMSQADAVKALKAAGVTPVVVENPSETVEKDKVIAQLPTAGSLVAPSSQVGVVVSAGPSQEAADTEVPSVVGLSRADAEKAISDAGLRAQAVEVSGTTETAGAVFAQMPDAGQMVIKGTTVTLLYAP